MNPPKSECDAVFLGWQKRSGKDIFPLFNITAADHPLYQSTVSEATLRREHLRVPDIPSPYPKTAPAPWHKFGVKLDHPLTAREALQTAGLDYAVVKKPLGLKTGLQSESYATVRADTGDILGVVSENYEPVQNVDAFTFFDSLVAGNEAIYETAGAFGHGELIWILARLPGHINVHGNDIVNKYLLLTNSHDGSSNVRAKLMPIRIICNNTLTSTLQGTGDIPFHDAPDTVRDIERAMNILRCSHSLFEELDGVFNVMAARKITDEQLREYVQALVPDHKETQNTARNEKIRASVIKLHECGRGAYLARGTVWGAFNSVAEYTDHIMSDEDSSARLDSIWFGRGEQLKAKAFRFADRMMRA